MATNTANETDTLTTVNSGEKKERTRINPRVKMVKALHSILGEQLRNNLPEEALETVNDMKNYLEQLNNGY